MLAGRWFGKADRSTDTSNSPPEFPAPVSAPYASATESSCSWTTAGSTASGPAYLARHRHAATQKRASPRPSLACKTASRSYGRLRLRRRAGKTASLRRRRRRQAAPPDQANQRRPPLRPANNLSPVGRLPPWPVQPPHIHRLQLRRCRSPRLRTRSPFSSPRPLSPWQPAWPEPRHRRQCPQHGRAPGGARLAEPLQSAA